MLIKNKINVIFFLLVNFFILTSNISADEFNISALEVSIDKQNNIINAKGSVYATDQSGNIIKSNNAKYKQADEMLLVDGSVKFFDTKGNTLNTDKLLYDKKNELIYSYENSELFLSGGYKISTNKILYNNLNKIVSSDQKSVLTDIDGNIVNVTMFQYNLEKKLFSSIGKIKIIDKNKNKYFFKELHVDTQKKEMIGSDVRVDLDQVNFGVSTENDPRFVANDIFVSKNESHFSKGIFTVCKQDGDKCPPWSLQAKKIKHNKAKKTIYYEHAILKVYDIPIFYFPKFYHPDPTVKRKSGILTPSFTNSENIGAGFGLPYFWAIARNKDLTFTPKIYNDENNLFFTEYRQAFEKGFLTLDTSYTSGYKNTTTTKTDGSRNHIFAEIDLDLAKEKEYKSNLSVTTQHTSNDTFFKIHDVNTALVTPDKTNLENKINYDFNNSDIKLNVYGAVYENTKIKNDSRYEYMLPNILFEKSFLTQKFGALDFKSNVYHRNYETNKYLTFLSNDILWSPASFISKKGFVNNFNGVVNNTNYEGKNTTGFKTSKTTELSSVISYKSSLPLKKDGENFSKIFTPNFMIRYAPFHMKDLSKKDTSLHYSNLYSINKTEVIEDGISAILGLDYKIYSKDASKNEQEKASISFGQVFNLEKNKDLPSSSSLDQRMSDVVGEINYNFSSIGKIGYKFSLDNNLNDLNYNQVSTNINFGKVSFNLDYLEEQNHVGNEHYIQPGITLALSENNKLNFKTKKNYTTDSTEFYDIDYEYTNDCLTAGLLYRREFYQDGDVAPDDTLWFTIKFLPFGGVQSPKIANP